MVRHAVSLFLSRITGAPSVNREGYPAWERSVEEQYIQTLVANTFRNTFYADAHTLLAESAQVHDTMLARDPVFAAKALVYARQRGFMRTQPIFGLVKLSAVDRDRFKEIFDRVILTPADLSDFTAILKSQRKGEGGRAVKNAAGRWLLRLSEYQVIKYGSNRADGGYTLKDLLQVYHPRAGSKSHPVRLPLMDYVMNRLPENELTTLPQLKAFEALKQAATDEQKVEAIRDGRLPHEVATSFAGASEKVWDAIVPNLPIMALLRNLATLERHGVLEKNRELIEARLTDPATIAHSRILPFRFLEARRHVRSAWVQDALREALELSFQAVPEIEGRTVVVLDRSGSMGAYIQTAAVFAVSLMKKTRNRGRFMLFDDRLDEVPVSLKDSILTQAERIAVRGGTNHGLAMEQLTKDRDHVDNIIYITDEQQNQGSPLIDGLDRYRKKVNRDVKTFIVDVAPYRNALTPDDPNTFYVYGWSDSVLSFISMASQGWGNMVDLIRTDGWKGKREPNVVV